MGESRTDIIHWINTLLQLSYTKIEQLGTGAAYCQVIDSIYGDVSLSKVNFNANQEWQYMNNYKVLQAVFSKHQISNAIPVQLLMKLKFQDNLEFSQWLKKFWEANFNNSEYDAVARRGGSGPVNVPNQTPPSSLNASSYSLKKSAVSEANKSSSRDIGANVNTKSTGMAAASEPKTVSISSGAVRIGSFNDSNAKKPSLGLVEESPREIELTKMCAELRVTLETMERERDFYFGKLRELEVLLQVQAENLDKDELVKQIQEILYSTD